MAYNKFLQAKQADDDEAYFSADMGSIVIYTADEDVLINVQTGRLTSALITLSVTQGKESAVAEAVVKEILHGSARIIKLGDEVAKTYFHPDVTAVEAVTVDVAQA